MLNKSVPQNQKGFTLVEVSLALAILIIITGLSFTVYQSFQVKHNLDITTDEYAQSLVQAQIRSRAVKDDSCWSVHIQPGSITLFKGNDYGSRDPSFDEITNFPSNIIPSGLQTVTFDKFHGTTSNTGTTTLTSSTNEERFVTINEMGSITY
ncbi:MAG: type II secretion system protein [Patescibacteria group bacterium]|nr:type II secretion system protein [Patescibacteria group bacterium]